MVDCALRQMRLTGFRSISSQEVDFDNPTFVVGPNGSGKTNFADAFALLAEAMVSPLQAVIVIEEPEASMHPGALGSILDVLRLASRSMQVVVTTHSPDILDAKWVEDRHLRLLSWEHGSTRIRRVSKAVRSALAQHLMGAGELLRSNALTPEEGTDSDSQ